MQQLNRKQDTPDITRGATLESCHDLSLMCKKVYIHIYMYKYTYVLWVYKYILIYRNAKKNT
jgi:hypothetical protein